MVSVNMNSEKSDFLFITEWNWQKTLFLIIAIGLLGALAFNLAFLCTRSRDLINKPNVMNLDPYIISSKYYFPTSNEILPTKVKPDINWANEDFDDSKWANIELGSHDLRTLDGYKEASGIILQRVKIRVPDRIYDLDEPIAILMRTINFTKYELYFGNTIITESPATINPSAIGLFSIPKTYIDKTKTVVITIKGYFTAKNSGLYYNAPTLIGLKETLDNAIFISERADNSYPNVVAATKGGLLLFFVLLFLVTGFQRFMFFFLIYAVCNTIDSIFTMEYSETILNLNIRAFIVFNLQLIGFSFLWLLVESLLGVKCKIQRTILIIQIITINILLILFTNNLFKVDLNMVFEFHNAFITEILAAISILAFIEYKKQPQRKIANLSIIVFNSVFFLYFASYVIQRYLITNARKNGHHYIDILFFIFIAFVVASEFAKNQFNLIKQARILESQKIDVNLGQSAARIAHDIRKPFSNLKIALQTISNSAFDPNTTKRLFQELSKSIEYGENLAAEILQSKQNDIHQYKPFSILSLLEKFKAVHLLNLKNKNIDLTIEIKSNLVVLGSELKVFTIIQNIITNAEEALAKQNIKIIKITVADHLDSIGNTHCKITIENNGPIIPHYILNKLFQHSVTYGKETGTGLGLTGVKSLLNEMGGSISVYNLLNSKGVGFEILLLADQNSGLELTKTTELISNSNPINTHSTLIQSIIPKQIESIAVVDDDDLIHMAWKLAWKSQNIQLFERPEDLLDSMRADPNLGEKFDIIITDRFFGHKSNKSGLDLCNELNKIGYTKVVLCSGSEDISKDQSKNFLKVIPKQVLTQTQLHSLFIEE